MRVRRLVAVILLTIPTIFVLLWHLGNREVPNDDAANFGLTALQIATHFKEGPLAGISAMLNVRGWRPTSFPALSVPFVLLSGGDVVAGSAATLLAICAALTFYLYRLARLFSADPLLAATITAAVVSMPVMISYSLVFFSESAWVLFSVAFVYHLVRSGPFRLPSHALAAGLYAGLMGTIRPVESLGILAVFLAFLMFPEFRAKRLEIKSSFVAAAIFSFPALVLACSAWVSGITRLHIWLAAITATVFAVMFLRRLNASLTLFFCSLTTVTCFWWAGFMPGLVAWAREATAYNWSVRATDTSSAYRIVEAFLNQIRDYGQVQIAVVGCLGILLIVTAVIKKKESKEHSTSREGANVSAWPLLLAAATMLIVFMAVYSSGGNDRRRILVALALTVVSGTAIAAARLRLAVVAVVFLVVVQFAVIGSALAGHPVWAATNGFGIPSPHRAKDGNVEAARVLAKYVPHGNNVAVYTLALLSPRDRVYEPNALKLALLQEKSGFDCGYYWDEGSYDKALSRYYRGNFKYLLLDSFSTVGPNASRDPYAQLAVDLLRRARAGETENPRLRMIARFQIGERDQTLFRIVPDRGDSDNLASVDSGARPLASEQQEGFPIANLNDGTASAWGSMEGASDIYAGVALPSPLAVHTLKVRLMTPDGRAHLRNIRIVAADREGPAGPDWQFLRARVKGSTDFVSVLTIPALPDNSVVEIEIDPADPLLQSHLIWGLACLRSKGDAPNYLNAGTGVYIRELILQ
jgi:hypothetical protein